MSLYNLIVTISFSAEDMFDADKKSDEILDLIEDEGFLVEEASVELAIGVR